MRSDPNANDPIKILVERRISGELTDQRWKEFVEPIMDEYEKALPGKEKAVVREKLATMLQRLKNLIWFS